MRCCSEGFSGFAVDLSGEGKRWKKTACRLDRLFQFGKMSLLGFICLRIVGRRRFRRNVFLRNRLNLNQLKRGLRDAVPVFEGVHVDTGFIPFRKRTPHFQHGDCRTAFQFWDL